MQVAIELTPLTDPVLCRYLDFGHSNGPYSFSDTEGMGSMPDRAYYQENKAKMKAEYNCEYYQKNRAKLDANKREYQKKNGRPVRNRRNVRSTDKHVIQRRISCRLRAEYGTAAIRGNGTVLRMIGATTWQEVCDHLTPQMNGRDIRDLEIDHIVELSSDHAADVKCHYRNMQFLTRDEHRAKTTFARQFKSSPVAVTPSAAVPNLFMCTLHNLNGLLHEIKDELANSQIDDEIDEIPDDLLSFITELKYRPFIPSSPQTPIRPDPTTAHQPVISTSA